MRITVEVLIQITGFIFILLGMAYRLAKIEAAIQSRIAEVASSLAVHLADYKGDHQMTEYRLNGLDEKIDHKFKRLEDKQKEIQQFLSKEIGFAPREH